MTYSICLLFATYLFTGGLGAPTMSPQVQATAVAQTAPTTTIMVVRPDNSHFARAAAGLQHHLDPDLSLQHFFVSKQDKQRRRRKLQQFHQAVLETKPRLFVLMNNYSVAFLHDYQALHPEYKETPCLVMMAVFAEKAVSRLPNATAIRYEIPAITNLVNLRALMKTPIQRVGVIYRPHLREYVANQIALCQKEEIELTAVEVEDGWGITRRIRRALDTLVKDKEIDALWVINDSELLSPRLIQRSWNPALQHFQKPVVTGVENFVSNPNLMGSFGVVPDHYDLGQQASELLISIRQSDWQAAKVPVSYPFSVRKILNLDKINTAFTLRDHALLEIDQVITHQPETQNDRQPTGIQAAISQSR